MRVTKLGREKWGRFPLLRQIYGSLGSTFIFYYVPSVSIEKMNAYLGVETGGIGRAATVFRLS